MENILLIEDDTTLAMGIEYSLEDEGMEVEVKYNIKDGYDIGKREFSILRAIGMELKRCSMNKCN